MGAQPDIVYTSLFRVPLNVKWRCNQALFFCGEAETPGGRELERGRGARERVMWRDLPPPPSHRAVPTGGRCVHRLSADAFLTLTTFGTEIGYQSHIKPAAYGDIPGCDDVAVIRQ